MKRARDDSQSDEENNNNKRQACKKVNHTDSPSTQPDIAFHYNSRAEQTREDRKESKIIHLRNFNNWIKTVLLDSVLSPGCGVLDLCSGKGGDIFKFRASKVGFFVAADHAERSVMDSIFRYNAILTKGHTPPPPAKFIVADCHKEFIDVALDKDVMFDVVSCQFALHYSFETEARARGLMRNVSSRLKPGGFFIGSIPDARVLKSRLLKSTGNTGFYNPIYKVDFAKPGISYTHLPNEFGVRYEFTLQGAVHKCPEYLVPFDLLKKLAEEEGMELVHRTNFQNYYAEMEQVPKNKILLKQMNVLKHVDKHSGHDTHLTQDEWDVCGLYMVFIFRKRSILVTAASQSALNPAESVSPLPACLSRPQIVVLPTFWPVVLPSHSSITTAQVDKDCEKSVIEEIRLRDVYDTDSVVP